MSGLGLLYQRREGWAIGGGHVGQNLAIQLDARFLQAIDELAIGYVGRAASSPDANDP